MIVVADTSPLSYLIRLGYIDLLALFYKRVVIPQAVSSELRHSEAPPEVRAWAKDPPVWVDVQQVQQLDPTLPLELGSGEREAISLARNVHADLLLVDERAGREAAEARGIPIAGTLAVLLEASRRGQLNFQDALEGLRLLNFRISPVLRRHILLIAHKGQG